MRIIYSTTNAPLNPVLDRTFRMYIPEPTGQIRGKLSEQKAEEALCVMSRSCEGIRELKVPQIVSFKSTRNRPDLDYKGIDFVVTLADGCEIPVQIKSSERGARKFARKHRLREEKGWINVLTEAIVVEPYEQVRSVIRKISDYLNRAYLKIRREHGKLVNRLRQMCVKQKHVVAKPQKHFRYMGFECAFRSCSRN